MTSSIRFPALGANQFNEDGGYATFCLGTLKKVDRRVRHILYTLKSVKADNSVDAYFAAKEVFEAVEYAVSETRSRLEEKQRECVAAAHLIESGRTDAKDVDYDSPMMRKAADLRYHKQKLLDDEPRKRLNLKCSQLVQELRKTAKNCTEELKSHASRHEKYAPKFELANANIEYLALRHGLFDHERYDYAGRSLDECKADASAVISKHVDEKGTVNV